MALFAGLPGSGLKTDVPASMIRGLQSAGIGPESGETSRESLYLEARVNRTRTLLVLITLISCLVAPAQAQKDPAQAVKAFFQAVSARDYGRAWNLLSSTSQNRIVNMVANDEKMSTEAVRRLFETHDPSICTGFWDSFRASSHSEILAGRTFITGQVVGNRGSVRMQENNEQNFVTVLEKGSWRFGMMESLPAQP
jgi:hypothetical protein